jgi:hypothetical protein
MTEADIQALAREGFDEPPISRMPFNPLPML